MDDNTLLRAAAVALLARLDVMTTDDFQRGGEREEREALRAALAGVWTPRDLFGLAWPWDVELLERLARLDATVRRRVLDLVIAIDESETARLHNYDADG